jgi:hypothetical protein
MERSKMEKKVQKYLFLWILFKIKVNRSLIQSEDTH